MSNENLSNENRLNLRNKIIKYNIKLCWMKAHVGYAGNKRVDHLAKAALSKNHIDIFFHSSKRYIRKLLKQKYIHTWQND